MGFSGIVSLPPRGASGSLDGWATTWLPGLPGAAVAARERLDDGAPQAPGKSRVDRDEHTPPEQRAQTRLRRRAGTVQVPPGHLGLRALQQVPLGVASEPLRKGHHHPLTEARPFWA